MNGLMLVGPIKEIGPTEKVVANSTAKEYFFRHLILDLSEVNQTTGQVYEKLVNFQFSGDKCQILDNFVVGGVVQVSFNIRSRMYAKKDGSGNTWITSADAYKIEQVQPQPQHQPQQQYYQQPVQGYVQQPAQGYQQPPQKPQGNYANPQNYIQYSPPQVNNQQQLFPPVQTQPNVQQQQSAQVPPLDDPKKDLPF